MLYLNKITKRTVGIVLSITIFINANNVNEIVTAIKEICNAPSEKRSSYFKIKSKGKANLKIKIIGVSGDATLTKEEWEGVQRVLRKDQANDNKSYRECSMKLFPVLIKNFSSIVKEKNHKGDTYNKSPRIENANAPITIEYHN